MIPEYILYNHGNTFQIIVFFMMSLYMILRKRISPKEIKNIIMYVQDNYLVRT